MKIAIRFSAAAEKAALPILLRGKPGMILPDRTYVLEEEIVAKVRAAGIRFKELSREGEVHLGELSGERI